MKPELLRPIDTVAALIRVGRFLAAHPLTRDQKLRAFGRFIRWQIASRVRGELVVPWIEGTRLAVRRSMTGATGNIYAGLHEFADMAFVLHLLRQGDLFADVGANVGSYTVLASGVRRARSIAFEPDPQAVAALHRNIAINRLAHLVAVQQMALGAQPGETVFTIGRDTMNRIATDDSGPMRIVRLSTLDLALHGEVPTLIKLDVEGHESEVLRGAARTLASHRLKAVLTEDRSATVARILDEASFERHSYNAFTRDLVEGDDQHTANALFVRDHAFVQQRILEAPAVCVLGRTL